MFKRLKRYLIKAWDSVKSFGRKLFTKSHLIQATYFVGTVSLSALVLNWALPTWMAALVLGVVVVHEFAHYFTALSDGRKTYLPFFIPFIYGIIGGTRVKGHIPESDMKIALAGPSASALVCAVAIAVFLQSGFMPGVWCATWLLVSQVYAGTFGGDGRKYREAKSKLVPSYANVLYGAPI